MRVPSWLRDTFARRFASAILLAVAIFVFLNGIVQLSGGRWAQQNPYQSGLFDQATSAMRVFDHAPAEARPALLTLFRSDMYQTFWYAKNSAIASALNAASGRADQPTVQPFRLNGWDHKVLLYGPGNPQTPAFALRAATHPKAYFLATALTDESWLVLMAARRTWGLQARTQIGLELLLLGAAAAFASLVQARWLKSPLARLILAVRRFGTDPQAVPVHASGPIEFRSAADAFNAMQTQVQRFVADRTTMLAAISHDLRAPLTRMRLRAEFIADPDQQAKLFRDIDIMQEMVSSALGFFQEDADGETVTKIDLAELLRTTIDGYSDQGLAVGYTGPDHVVFVGRPAALRRVFTNLIDNAFKHALAPTIDLRRGDHAFLITVRDLGPGIPEDLLHRVFAPFFTVDRSPSRAANGVGLGLSSARSIIRGHGGDINLHNRSPKGLDVQVTLPIFEPPYES